MRVKQLTSDEDILENAASFPSKRSQEPKRMPFGEKAQQLLAPKIPGYRTHWAMGDPISKNNYLEAGFTFVRKDEIFLNNRNPADHPDKSGNDHMGDYVMRSKGMRDPQAPNGMWPQYLMKLPLEYDKQDEEYRRAKNLEQYELIGNGVTSGGIYNARNRK